MENLKKGIEELNASVNETQRKFNAEFEKCMRKYKASAYEEAKYREMVMNIVNSILSIFGK